MTEDLKTPPADAELPNRAPRVTPADIEENIHSEHYFTAGDGVIGVSLGAFAAMHGAYPDEVRTGLIMPSLNTLTFCVLVLRNGFTVTGESACASPENFDAGIGRRIARQDAFAKVWPLLGFRLRDRLTDPEALQD